MPDRQDPALRIPPHSIQAEQAVIGSLLMDRQAWERIAGTVAAEDFYRPDHRIIFEAIAELVNDSKALDVLTLSDQLERRGQLKQAGGLAYLSTLVRDTPTAANALSYAQAVRDRAALRRLNAFGNDLVSEIMSGERSAHEIATAAQERLLHLQSRLRQGRGLVDSRALVADLLDDLDQRSSGQRGLQLGLPDFDALTSGLEPGDLVVIAGRPGMGKTALLVSVAAHVGQARHVAIFSAEMPARQLTRRCLSLVAGIPQGKFRKPEGLTDTDWATVASGASALAERRIWIDDTSQPALTHIRSEVTALKGRVDLGLVLVDYVQLVSGKGRNRYEELRDVAYGLKALAKDLAVPIIVLAQLNRDVEGRDKKRPSISDLRDSGAIEEAADIIGLLYSEGYYDTNFDMPYVLECNVGKNRNGERGQCLWSFAGDRSLVQPLDSGAAIHYRRLVADMHRGPRSRMDAL